MALVSLDAAAKDIIAYQADVVIPQSKVADSLTIAEINSLLVETPDQQSDVHRTLLILEAGLRVEAPLYDVTTTRRIWNWTLYNVFGTTHLNDDYLAGGSDRRDVLCEIALYILIRLAELHPDLLRELTPSQISSLILCSTSSAIDLRSKLRLAADKLLSEIRQQRSASSSHNSQILITTLLEQVIRPSFAQSRSKNVTPAGRKAIDPLPQALTTSEDERSLKPWKFTQKYVINVLRWVLEHSDAQEIEANWHLIAPPILTLIDDEATTSKINGCNLLQTLLIKVSVTTWTRTGLGKVFEAALTPALAYLPPLTEQDEAEKLMITIYPTLISLCNHQFSLPDQHSKKLAMLDHLLRTGVLSGLAHSGENVKISVLLLDQLCVLLPEMGIHCVKHLKPIVAVLVGYLCDPFAFASTPLLQSVLEALKCLIVNAWPRMDRYSGEIFKGIAVCWQRLSEEPSSQPVMSIQGELKVTLQLLVRTLEGYESGQEITRILQNDDVLSGLLL